MYGQHRVISTAGETVASANLAPGNFAKARCVGFPDTSIDGREPSGGRQCRVTPKSGSKCRSWVNSRLYSIIR